jgi:TusA-related sulfurtransferase
VNRHHESTPMAGKPPTSSWLLEGGEDPWPDLRQTLTRCLDELATGGVLELISWVPGIEVDISTWCRGAGHELLHVLRDGANTRHWIKKGETPPPCGMPQSYRRDSTA